MVLLGTWMEIFLVGVKTTCILNNHHFNHHHHHCGQ